MRALVLKDLHVLRPWWGLIVPAHVLFSANGIVSPHTFFAMNVALAWAYTVVLIVVEWRQDAERFVGSLPVRREDVVRARYVGALGAAVCGTALYAVYGRVLFALGAERLLRRWPDTPGWESPGGLLALFLSVWLGSVAYLPFYFRSGLGRGTWLFVTSLTPLVVGAVLLIPRLGPAEPPGLSTPAGTGAAMAIGLGAAIALGWLSLRLSIRFYERRDL